MAPSVEVLWRDVHKLQPRSLRCLLRHLKYYRLDSIGRLHSAKKR